MSFLRLCFNLPYFILAAVLVLWFLATVLVKFPFLAVVVSLAVLFSIPLNVSILKLTF